MSLTLSLNSIVAVAQIAMAIGIAHFWWKWFRTEHKEPWLPVGYVEHERVFVYPDSVMSVLMVISAVLLLLGHPLGERLTQICGGMMIFLAVIDTAYFYQHGMFRKDRNGLENWGLVLPMYVMSALMTIPFLL